MDSPTPIRILLIEDNPGDARLVQHLLKTQPSSVFQFVWSQTLADGIAQLSRHCFDIALLDLSLPDSQGLESLSRLRAYAPMLPVVVLTGHKDEAVAVQAVQQGSQDYLIKGEGEGDLLRRAIRYAIERSAADASLRRSESQFRAVFEYAGQGMATLDVDGHITSLNPALVDFLGANWHGRPILDVAHPDDVSAFSECLWPLLGGERDAFTLEIRLNAQNTSIAWAALTVSLVRSPEGAPQFAVAMVENITARKSLEEQQKLAARVLGTISEGVFITNADKKIVHVNPAFTRLTGFHPDDAVGKTPSILESGRHPPDYFIKMWRTLLTNGNWQGEVWNRRKSGELFATWQDISVIRGETGHITHYVSIFSDITARKESEERLTHRAHHDPLTGLPNRALFLERLDHAITRAQRNQTLVAVLFLDLDHFKQINDSLGHLAGDSLLQQVSERLTRMVRAEDTVARLGGDEFTLILEDITDFRDGAKVAKKILQQFSIPFILDEQPHRVTTSIGIGLYPADGETVETLLRQADEAMYASKKQGRDSFRFASADLSERVFERQTMEEAMATAISSGQLEIYYQPIAQLTDLTVVGAEALLRWHHPEIGLMMPRQFLPLALETGLIVPLGRWVIREAMMHAVEWLKVRPDMRLAVNVSKQELQNPDFIPMIEGLLAESGMPSQSLDIEIPEHVVMEAAQSTLDALHALRTLGVHIALDDFGIGHTDLRILHTMPVDVVKIAPDFIRTLDGDGDKPHLVQAAVALARSMNIRVVAKGVETSAQLDFLRSHRCDASQGFLLSRPVPASEIMTLLPAPLVPKG